MQNIILLAAQAVPVLLYQGARDDPAHDVLPFQGIGLFLLAFSLMSVVGVQIGFALSSLARTTTQATLWVPLALIPQILFSGFVISLPEMPDSARICSHLVPSSSAQRLIDPANVAGKRIPLMTDDTEVPMFFWTSEQLKPFLTPGARGEAANRNSTMGGKYREIDEYNTSWQNSLVDSERIGDHKPAAEVADYVNERPDILGKVTAGTPLNPSNHSLTPILELLGWMLVCYLLTWLGLCLAQPAPLRPRWLQASNA